MSLVDRFGVPIEPCVRPGCVRRATRYLEIAVPPRAYPMNRALKATLGLRLCATCADKEKAETFLTDQTRATLSAMVAKSPVPLDFDRARLNVRVLGDENWKRYSAVMAEGRERRAG